MYMGGNMYLMTYHTFEWRYTILLTYKHYFIIINYEIIKEKKGSFKVSQFQNNVHGKEDSHENFHKNEYFQLQGKSSKIQCKKKS